MGGCYCTNEELKIILDKFLATPRVPKAPKGPKVRQGHRNYFFSAGVMRFGFCCKYQARFCFFLGGEVTSTVNITITWTCW